MLDTTVTTDATRPTDISPARPAAPHRRPLDGRAIATLLTAYAAFVGIGALAGAFLTSWASEGALGRLDRSISTWLEAQRTTTLNTASNFGSGLSDTLSVVAIIAVVSVVFWLTWRRWDEITLLATALALEVTTFVSIAYVVGRNRPPVEQLDPSPPTSGFPSGHTAAAVALYFGLALVVYLHSDSRIIRRMAAALATVAVIAVAASRMYRGMHFLTDVVAGAVLGAACLLVAWSVMRAAASRRPTTDHPWSSPS